MKKNFKIWLMSFLLLSVAGCDIVHEFPDTSGGKEPVDPTEIETTVKVECKIEFDIHTSIESKSSTPIDVRQETPEKYDRRFIVEVFHDESYDQSLVETDTIFTTADTIDYVTLQTKLHAMKYKMVVWMDYVLKGTYKDLYYQTNKGLGAIHVPSKEKYVAGTDFKDGQFFSDGLDLTPYADQWFADITVTADLQRPLAKVTYLASDIEEFAKKSSNVGKSYKEIADSLTVEFYYIGYLPTGFNTYTGRLNDSETGFNFYYQPSYPYTYKDKKLTIVGSDYVFVNGETSSVTVGAIIRDKNGNVVNEVNNIVVPIKRGAETVVTYKFFTKDYTPGIGIDPSFSGEFDVYV